MPRQGCRNLSRLRHGRTAGFLVHELDGHITALLQRPTDSSRWGEPVCPRIAERSPTPRTWMPGRSRPTVGGERLGPGRWARGGMVRGTCSPGPSYPTVRGCTWAACSTPRLHRWTSAHGLEQSCRLNLAEDSHRRDLVALGHRSLSFRDRHPLGRSTVISQGQFLENRGSSSMQSRAMNRSGRQTCGSAGRRGPSHAGRMRHEHHLSQHK